MKRDPSIETRADKGDEKGSVGAQTLMRGLDVLDAIADGPIALNELSDRLGLTKSTTHRLAAALTERRFLSFRAREGYSLGPKLLELGWAARQQVQVARVARAHLEALSQATEDAVHLGVLDGDQALYLDKVPGRRRVNIGSRVGDRQPIASTGLGKALVLDMTEDRWRDLYDAGGVHGAAGGVSVFLERMRGYAQKGYAFDLEENEDQIRCVAAPIRGVDGAIVAAISLSSAAQYMDDGRMQSLILVVQDAARDISSELGWSDRKGGMGVGPAV